MTKRLVLLTLLSCLLAACGNKGPLVLPEKPAADAPVAPDPAAPAGDAAGTPSAQP
ncbi:LPS translocon maturation chaperone LptM [Thermomonas sp.]|uniref:LPS translocon maturation chaperone LptM n=1 Tax=Thermomonas sp. TaxID=1971895 RepID=UPI00391CF2BE